MATSTQLIVVLWIGLIFLNLQSNGIEALGGGVGGGGAHAPGGHGFGGIRGLGSGRGFGGGRLGLRGRGTRYSFGYRKQARRGYTWGPPGPRAGRFGRRPGGGIILAGVPAGGWGSDDFFLWNYGLYG